MVNAGIEEHIAHNVLGQGRLVQHVGQTAITAPVIGHRATAVGDNKTQLGKVREQIGLDKLHKRGGVGVDVMRAGGMKIRIAGSGDVNHRRHIQLDHLFEEGIPGAVGQRRRVPVSPRGIGIEITADKTVLDDAALQFRNGVLNSHARRLGQLAHADKIPRVEIDDPLNQIVAGPRPLLRHRAVAQMMRHG